MFVSSNLDRFSGVNVRNLIGLEKVICSCSVFFFNILKSAQCFEPKIVSSLGREECLEEKLIEPAVGINAT